MKVLIFEWLVGGGMLVDGEEINVDSSLFRQGAAMWRAIRDDFRSAGHQVLGTYDFRLKACDLIDGMVPTSQGLELPDRLLSLARSADAIFLVAPETGKRLLRCVGWLEEFSDRFISPGRRLVELASSKDSTCELLRSAGVQSFDGATWKNGLDWPPAMPLPAVLKPDDGAGGEGFQIIRDWEVACRPKSGVWRCEGFLTGASVSIAAICRPGGFTLLEPMWQQFEKGLPGIYAGGQYPVSPRIRKLARQIAASAIECLPNPIGFIGLDLIVDETAARATVLEVNPRLTTSYIGLRQRCDANLASLLLADCPTAIQWRDEPLEFRI